MLRPGSEVREPHKSWNERSESAGRLRRVNYHYLWVVGSLKGWHAEERRD
jgi:hypothetical protein